MKTIYSFLVCLLFVALSSSAQDITGKWYGQADVGVMRLRMNLTLEKSGDNYSGFLVSPDQSSQEIPLTTVMWEKGVLNISIAPIGFTYEGTWKEGEIIEGSFKQMGTTFPLNLSRNEIVLKRPQEPKPPYPYQTEEVSFRNDEADVKLAGTLTIPDGKDKYPAVVLVTGSGPQNRDEELLGHKPFWVIADYLTRHGIAVLRYDERGVGQSEGNYNDCGIPEFADDAAAAITYLKTRNDIDSQDIGIIGHSEGGAVAVLLASKKIPSFIVSLAGPGVNGREVMRTQRKAIFRKMGLNDEYITQYNETMSKVEDLVLDTTVDKSTWDEQVKTITAGTPLTLQTKVLLAQLTSPAMLSLLRYEPIAYFGEITCPVLALNGDKDVQVISDANLEGFNQIAANGNKQITIKEYQGLNHLFQTATTGMPTEYGQIEETINPGVLKDIADWIKKIKE